MDDSATRDLGASRFPLDTPKVPVEPWLPFMIEIDTCTPAPGPALVAGASVFAAADFVRRHFPRMRYMGSKFRLLDWIHEVTSRLEFGSVLDAFGGSNAVGYLFKAAGKSVTSNDSLEFSHQLARALIANSKVRLSKQDLERLRVPAPDANAFIQNTFSGIFYTPNDLEFLDRVWANLARIRSSSKRALALSSLIRACAKRQPRGVFTVAGDPSRYKDARRDLRLSLEEHFVEGTAAFNEAVFDNRRENRALRTDIFAVDPIGFDLVYLDPPYVPRSDDNCYVKRYHFLEGLSRYWRGVEILEDSRVRKIKKPFTPFGYRRTAVDAFTRLFERFSRSLLVLSYSSNGYPDLPVLVDLMRRFKQRVTVHERAHRYHFGTHAAAARNSVTEYLIVGT